MATAALSPRPPPQLHSATGTSDSWHSSSIQTPQQQTMSIQDEVRLAHEHLVSRLSGALTTPPASTPSHLLPSVPLIDLSPSFPPHSTISARKAVAAEIRAACLTTGFFQISNHSVTPAACDGVLKQAERFFSELDANQKDALHIRRSRLFRGYEPGGFTYVNPDDLKGTKGTDCGDEGTEREDGEAETKEGFNWGYEPSLDPTGGDGKYVELDGSVPSTSNPSNVWPLESDLPGFKAGIAAYYGQVLALARHLFRLFALSLDLDEKYFDALTTHPGGIGRLLWYPAQPPVTEKAKHEAEKGKLGLGAHTDYECFTLLLSSSNPGLEILFPPSPLTDNKPLWRPCPVRPGTLTVNVADFLMRWTNGLYKSTIHRVVSQPGGGERYSVPFFFSINYDSEVRQLPEHAVGGTMYQPMRVGEYILERLKATAPETEEKKVD